MKHQIFFVFCSLIFYIYDANATCGINEELRLDSCDGTCANPDLKYCDLAQTTKCFCLANHLRDAQGKCVPESECGKCKQTCGCNEVWREGTCDGTCTQPNRMCGIMNHWACFCVAGYVRDSQGQCIPLQKCPTLPVCNTTEVLNVCPIYCTFDTDCAYLLEGIVRDCAEQPDDYQCQPRCDCKPDLVRIGTECLSPSACCPRANEILVTCPAACDVDTDGVPLSNCNCFINGCRCDNDFGRDASGVCVPICLSSPNS